MLYHAITILSCRSKIWAEPHRSSISYLRQSLSTGVLSTTNIREIQDQLVLFPFIPYAMSLSLSVAYREMRHNKVPLYRTRARTQFQAICDLLTVLEDVFRSASTTAEMGKKLLKEMDRVVSTVAVPDQRKSQNVFGSSTEQISHNLHAVMERSPKKRKTGIMLRMDEFPANWQLFSILGAGDNS
jgi:hypothetical protein